MLESNLITRTDILLDASICIQTALHWMKAFRNLGQSILSTNVVQLLLSTMTLLKSVTKNTFRYVRLVGVYTEEGDEY